VTASLTAIQKEHFQDASSIGWTTGANVYVQKSSSLNMTRLYIIHFIFTTNYVPVYKPFHRPQLHQDYYTWASLF